MQKQKLKYKLEDGTYFQPMLCEDGTEEDLEKEDRIAELKVDGGRVVAERNGDGLRIYSRRGLLYKTLPDISASLSKIRAFFILDGEMTYIDSNGNMVFEGSQKRLQISNPDKVERMADQFPLIYFVFDICSLNGEDLTMMPYVKRRAILSNFIALQKTLYGINNIRLIPTSTDNIKMYEWAKSKGFEGVVLKKLDGKYYPDKRHRNFLKVKCRTHTIHIL